jgi:ribosomal protein L11 methyltransferase
VAVRVPLGRGEQARARLIDLAPGGFEETTVADTLELAAYVDDAGEEAMRAVFGGVSSVAVAPGWEDAWRRFHRPVLIGPLWIGPPWEEPDTDALAVVIDPGRAFGTGAHPTTRLCIEHLLDVRAPVSVLDVGCGSGVLAIAAARLGFDPVTAIDADEAALAAARANAAVNGVRLAVERADALTESLPRVAVAVANIELAAVEAVGERVAADVFIASGYRAGDEPVIEGWEPRARRVLHGWAADRFERVRTSARARHT